ncbi:MAG: hypothetical protein LBU83_07130 [Bacteroidales bacterium]|jgi:organic radical activating enzyme|nr:hypothetical protein [Bacteroidales bacterium]
MSKKQGSTKKVLSLPQPLTREWLAGLKDISNFAVGNALADFFQVVKNAGSEVLSSREMEIALADHIFLHKNYCKELDEFFAENYPDTLKNAMRLGFKYYLGEDIYGEPIEHPHFQFLLDLIKEKPGFSDFYEVCCSLKKDYDTYVKNVRKTWLKVKDISFEKAILAVNVLYIKIFSSHLNDFHEQYNNILQQRSTFLCAINTYLNKIRKNGKPINGNIWKNEKTFTIEMDNHSENINKELKNILTHHIQAIMQLRVYRSDVCDSFIYDNTFEYDMEKRVYEYNYKDDVLCDMKNRLLLEYYESIGIKIRTDIYTLLLMDYFGLEEEFSHNGKSYNLYELLFEMEFLNRDNLFDVMNDTEEEVSLTRQFYASTPDRCDRLKLLSTDISNNESQIDLSLYNIFYYGQSDMFVTFPHIAAAGNFGYFALIHRLRKYNNNCKEVKLMAGRIENIVVRLFEKCPAPIFADAKITSSYEFDRQGIKGEIDVAIYKDKTLILIEVKSTYGIVMLDERFRHERHLIYAGHQLNKVVKALQEDAELLAEVTGDKNIKFDDLKVETMIVSTSFEFDGQKFQGHKKRSLLELMLALRNNAYDLVRLSPKIKNQYQNNPNNKISLKNLDLYDTKTPSVEDFLNALNFNIWEEVLPYWEEKL